MITLSDTQRTLLSCLSAALFQCPLSLDAVNWQDVFQEAKMQCVVPLVFSVAEPYISKDALPAWKQYAHHQLAENMQVEWEHAQVHQLMTAANIPYTVLKGCASAVYYPEPILRTMGDVDFMVKKEDLERAGKVLEKAGLIFDPPKGTLGHHLNYYLRIGDRTSAWEMHHEPNGIPEGPVGEKVRDMLSDIWNQATLAHSQSGDYKVPSAFHHGLVLLLHTATHMVVTGVGLRHLCDWAMLVNSLSDGEFTDIFKERLQAVGLWRFAQLLTAVSVKYLGCSARTWAANRNDDAVDGTIADIFAGGNFGLSDPERMNEAKMIEEGGQIASNNIGLFRQLVRTINDRAKTGMPLARKYPILLPAAWVYVGCRHILRILKGERPKIHPRKMLQNAATRKQVYQSFHLFEPEASPENH